MPGRTASNESRYDRIARFYRLVTRLGSVGTIAGLYRAAADSLEVAREGLVVDVGCGPATLTPYLLRRLGASARVIGVDVSQEMIASAERLARRNAWTNVEFVRASALDFEPSAPAHAVVFCLSLSLLPDPERCLVRALSYTWEGVCVPSRPPGAGAAPALRAPARAPAGRSKGTRFSCRSEVFSSALPARGRRLL